MRDDLDHSVPLVPHQESKSPNKIVIRKLCQWSVHDQTTMQMASRFLIRRLANAAARICNALRPAGDGLSSIHANKSLVPRHRATRLGRSLEFTRSHFVAYLTRTR
jgi:hypothetical protein